MSGELSRHALGLSAAGAAAVDLVSPDEAGDESSASRGATVVVVLADIEPRARLWGYSRYVFGRRALRAQPGVRFAKQLGSGYEGGFGLKPSATRQGLLCLFADAASAADFVEHSALVDAYRSRARELLTVRLRAYSCRGSWDGTALPLSAAPPAAGPIAGLTRASIRPTRAAQFWRRAPPAERSLAEADGCVLATGLGEAPVLRQATFSIWDSAGAMDRYARTGAHLEAIRAARDGAFFSESMFARFVVDALQGQWKGRHYG
jgi:hypothetical protein